MRYNFNLKYTQNDFIDFLSNDFLPEDFESDIENLEIDFQSKYIDADRCFKIGYSKSLELPVLEIWHNSEHDPRVGISKELFRLMGNFGYRQVLAVFVSTNSDNYRLSLATVELEAKGKKIERTYSNPKRYSFFLGPDAKTRTPEAFLLKKGRVKDFDDLLKRFSIEVVNKEFYDSIAKLFTDLVGGERGKGKNKYVVSKEDSLLRLPSTDDDQTRKEFAVRLIGRILFSWFLKKKKSANGISLLSDEILSVEAVKNSNNYYHDKLEPLFFEVLNTPIEARKEEFKQKPWDLTPFLNGGLFEPLDGIDFYKCNDAILRNTLVIKNNWFYDVVDGKETGLLSLFETYNFTIDESTSIDIDLSIDPEMLGRVFENLLAEINPETGESARKSSGSFYTPRPIVEYMVDESIKEYLLTKTEIQKERIENLLSIEIDDVDFDDTEKSDILKAINEVKILDPACGSGAFPMGVLQKLVEIVNKIDPDNLKWKEEQKEKEIGDKIRKLKEDIDFANQINDDEIRNTAIQQIEHKLYEIDHNFEIKNADYLRKLYLISNCIYGVDIQEIAVEISKLRCFLSLIVDEKVIDDSSNCGIYPLPNLEFKFVAANTLIGLDDSVKNLFTSDINSLEKELKSYMEAYYSADTKEKKLNAMESYNRVREEINGKIFDQIQSRNKGLQNKIFVEKEKIEQIKLSLKNGKINSATQKRLNSLEKKIDEYKKQIHENSEMATSKGVASWDPFSHNSSSWFDSEWMFGIKDGFDIVIGNPPYGAKYTLEDISKEENDRLKAYFKGRYRSTKTIKGKQKGSLDTYSLFIDFGLFQINKESTILTFIVPLSITSSESMSALHNMIFENCSKVWISTYFDRPKRVFDNAEQPVAIIIASNDKSKIKELNTTKLNKRNAITPIEDVITNLKFINSFSFKKYGRLPKIGTDIELNILKSLEQHQKTIKDYISKKESQEYFYYRQAGGRYYKLFTNFSTKSTQEKIIYLNNIDSDIIGGILSSNLYWWFHHIYSDIWHIKSNDLNFFPIPEINSNAGSKIIKLFEDYNANLKTNSREVGNHTEYYARLSKHIIDQIDDIICPIYGLSKEETEFVKNYELEFRVDDDEV